MNDMYRHLVHSDCVSAINMALSFHKSDGLMSDQDVTQYVDALTPVCGDVHGANRLESLKESRDALKDGLRIVEGLIAKKEST